jgi:hypothetical protein
MKRPVKILIFIFKCMLLTVTVSGQSLSGDYKAATGLREGSTRVDGMRWYYGAAGHAAFATGNYYNDGRSYDRGSDFAPGVDGIVGGVKFTF